MKNNINNRNNRNYEYSIPEEADGANSGNIWRIYRMLPINTCFTLSLHDSDNNVHNVTFMKFNETERELGEHNMAELLKCYRKPGYRSIQLIWNQGFGNSVTLDVFL